ncbi:MAG: hypothetical protein LBH82_00155 [Bacteroidales bacterium]|jgi:hypothetical protein|nr:hypothetical protein [Bacteroidales bacterium]
MENRIKGIDDFVDWINSKTDCFVSEQEEDFFAIQAPNDAKVFVDFEASAGINNIVCSAIKQLKMFNADYYFDELWSSDFAERFTPQQFIDSLKEDEASFRALAEKLR